MFLHLRNLKYLKILRGSSEKPDVEHINRFGEYYICYLGSKHAEKYAITNSCSSGMDKNKNVAVAKCISEFIERAAFRHGLSIGDPHCRTQRSEGFAALPLHVSSCEKKVRDISLCESIERYSWPHFWHHDIGFTKESAAHSTLSFSQKIPLQSLEYIFPDIDSKYIFCICLGKIGSDGAIVGSACAKTKQEAQEHAMTEMIRHYIGVVNIRNGYESQDKNYGNRLKYLSEKGFSLYKKRLQKNSGVAITLPKLEIDSIIDHNFSETHMVYRTRFFGQMQFINENIEVGYI